MGFAEKFENFVVRGRQILSTISEVQQAIPERRFKGKDIEDRLLMPLATIYTDEEKGKLPVVMERDAQSKRIGYTLAEINLLQEYYGTSPRRKDGDPPVFVSFTNQKGGCWKSTTAGHAASYYANLGYRVLLVDLDPQASTTENLGFQPNIQITAEHTLSPFIREEEDFPESDVGQIILDTHITNLKLIPSCLEMGYCDFDLTLKMGSANNLQDPASKREKQIHIFTRVRDILDIASEDFDIVILDGTPSLGLLPINIVLASDVLVVPVPTEICDFGATVGFCDLVMSEYNIIEEHLGSEITEQLFPDAVFVPTRYSSAKSTTVGSDVMLNAIRDTFGDSCTRGYIRKHDGVVSNLSMLRRTIFDVNPGAIKTSIGDINIKSDARKRAIKNYVEIFDQLLEEQVKPYWPSKFEHPQVAEI